MSERLKGCLRILGGFVIGLVFMPWLLKAMQYWSIYFDWVKAL